MTKTHTNKKRNQEVQSVDKTKSKTKTRTVKRENKKIEPTNESIVKLAHEQIAERAFMIWQNHGNKPFEDEKNWNEAEKQLKEELSIV